jgi:hypothetical protein
VVATAAERSAQARARAASNAFQPLFRALPAQAPAVQAAALTCFSRIGTYQEAQAVRRLWALSFLQVGSASVGAETGRQIGEWIRL